MNREAVLVFAPRQDPTALAGWFRAHLTAEIEARFDAVHVATPVDISRVRAQTSSALLTIVEAGALRDFLEQGASADRVWVLVLPSSDRRDPHSKSWVSDVLFARESLDAPRFIVDSEESKDQLEHVLDARRYEILVVPRVLVGAEPGARYDYSDWSLGPRLDSGSGDWGATWQSSDGIRADHDAGRRTTIWKQPGAANSLDRLAATERPEMVDQSASVLGANLNFIQQLTDELARGHVREMRTQEWTHISGPADPEGAQELLDSSDTVIAEWIRPNARWIQEHADPDRRLIVRGHRYEVTTDFPNMVDMGRYFAAVVITPWVGRKLVQSFDWPAEKIAYIPNFVESSYFAREKLDGAQFTLGMVGIRPGLKRVDLALDLLRALRERDYRYNLRIRSALPFDYVNWEKDPGSRAQWYETLARIKHDPILRGAVFFDAPAQDMSSWFRQIGVILSLSDLEGSHVALAEGIASGALGVARRWPGIHGMWPESIAHDTIGSAVEAILDVRHEGALEERAALLQQNPVLDSARVVGAWKMLIAGDLGGARDAFGLVDFEADLYAGHECD